MSEYELEEQRAGDTRQGSKGTERFIPGKLGNVDLPFGLGGRWVSQDEYQKIRTGSSNVSTSSERSGMPDAEVNAAQKEANQRRKSGEMPDLRGGPYRTKQSTGGEESKVERPKQPGPKQTGPKLVWNPKRMDFDTPEGKPAPYPKLPSPSKIDIKGLSAYRPGGPLPRPSSTRISISPSPTSSGVVDTTPTPAAPKPAGVSDGLKKWADIYGPGGKKQLKQPTPSQTRLFNRLKMEAYDVVLDYLLSEGHAETLEEAHYVMMQLDSEYVQSIVEQQAPDAKYYRNYLNDVLPGSAGPERQMPLIPPSIKQDALKNWMKTRGFPQAKKKSNNDNIA